MSMLRDLRYVVTEAAHLALDVVEHFTNTWAPLPDSSELRAVVANAHDADLRSELVEREAEEEVAESQAEYMDRVGVTISDEYLPVYEALKAAKRSKSSPAEASAGQRESVGRRSSEPPSPASPQLNLAQWLEPAIQEILACHIPALDVTCEIWCYSGLDEQVSHGPYTDWGEWREHVAALISEHVVVSLSSLWGRPL